MLNTTQTTCQARLRHAAAALLLGAAVFSSALSASPALAAPADTVAGNANAAGSVPVRFAAHGETLAGNLYIPPGCTAENRCPAIAVAHPWGGVKEQTAGFYAQQLAAKGFIALAFDAAHYGESTGEPRDFESPESRVEDIRWAVSYLSLLREADPGRIGSLGICAGGGYALHEAQSDPRVRAAAAVSAYSIGAAARRGIEGSPVTQAMREAVLAGSAEAFTDAAGGKPFERMVLLPDRSAWTASTDAFTREAWSYYRTERGAHPNARNQVVTASLALHQTYDPFAFMAAISPRPVLLIAGSEAETLGFSREAFERAAEPRELMVIEGAHHFDLYDKPEYAGRAVEKLADFFGKALR